MKIIAVNGSPRKEGNTDFLVSEILRIIEKNQIKTETILLRELKLEPCDACKYCREHPGRCHIKDDFSPVFGKVLSAEGLILATPVYFGSATPPIKAFMDRVGYVGRGMEKAFERKIGAGVVVARRAGHNFTLAQLYLFFSVMGIIIVPSPHYWTIAFGREKGEVTEDEEGMITMRKLADNIVWLAKRLYSPV